MEEYRLDVLSARILVIDADVDGGVGIAALDGALAQAFDADVVGHLVGLYAHEGLAVGVGAGGQAHSPGLGVEEGVGRAGLSTGEPLVGAHDGA